MHRCFAAVLWLLATSAVAAESPLWGKLEPGPHAIGFKQWEKYDYSRPYRPSRRIDGTPREGECARPMRISVWYPAQPGPGRALTLGDYVGMIGGETRLGALSEAQIREGEDAFFRFPLLRELAAEQRARLKALSGKAVSGARPAEGRFPVILYSLGSPALCHVTPEYLASHGYVVVQMPRLGGFAGLPDTGLDAADLATKMADMDFLINAVHELPSADVHSMGTIGFSAGGRWGLSQVMKHVDVRAMVSLDTVMLFDDGVTRAWKTMPVFDLDRVRVPVLHMIRKEWVPQQDLRLWDAMRYAERTYLRFDDARLDHLDFQSIGYALTLVGARAPAAAGVEAAFHLFNRYTRAFLDAHLKADAVARELLARTPERNGAPAGFVSVSRVQAQPAALTLVDLFNALDEGGVDPLVAAYRSEWKRSGAPPLPEAAVNLAGYVRLAGGRTQDALSLFALNVEAYPASPNVYDSLADAHVQAGDRAKARELAQKVLALLDQDTSLPPERKRLIRESAERKLAAE